MEGFHKNVDDILTTASSVAQMETRLRNLLSLCREKNIKLNGSKFALGHQVKFGGVDLMGIQKEGDPSRKVYMAPAAKRLEEFLDIKPPKNKKDVLRILGLAAQLKRWVPEMAYTTVHLRKLSSVHTRFIWTPDLQNELDELKRVIQLHVHLSPLDTTKPIHLHCDAATTIGMSRLTERLL